jgi:hypothetical protein
MTETNVTARHAGAGIQVDPQYFDGIRAQVVA